MKRIAIVTESRIWGGLEAHAVSLAETLNSSGIETVVACVGDPTYALYKQVVGTTVPLVKVNAPTGAHLHNPRRWLRALRVVGAEAAIFEKGTLFTGSLAFDLGMRLTFGPYLTIEQLEAPPIPARSSSRHIFGLVPGLGLWWYRWKLSGFLRSLSPGRTICISEAVRRRLVEMYGFASRRIEIIPHGVDLDQFRVDGLRRAAARASWDLPPDAFIFGTARRLVPDKGLDVALTAFAQAAKVLPGRQLHFVIAGDGPERQALENLASTLEIQQSVRFLGFHPRPWEIYPGFDSFILPSRIEALGVVALEAMACGCDLIASDVGGIPELIPNDAIASLVPADDPDALRDAMVASAQRDEEAMSVRQRRAQAHVVQNYDRRTLYLRIASALDEVRRPQARRVPRWA